MADTGSMENDGPEASEEGYDEWEQRQLGTEQESQEAAPEADQTPVEDPTEKLEEQEDTEPERKAPIARSRPPPGPPKRSKTPPGPPTRSETKSSGRHSVASRATVDTEAGDVAEGEDAAAKRQAKIDKLRALIESLPPFNVKALKAKAKLAQLLAEDQMGLNKKAIYAKKGRRKKRRGLGASSKLRSKWETKHAQ